MQYQEDGSRYHKRNIFEVLEPVGVADFVGGLFVEFFMVTFVEFVVLIAIG